MIPTFIVNGHDYTEYVQDIKPSRNDLDADGSGRNLLNGLMYRKRIAIKAKLSVSFLRLDETQMAQLENDLYPEYVDVTTLDPRTNEQVTRTYYTSTINNGIQRYIGGKTVYDGAAFDLTER